MRLVGKYNFSVRRARKSAGVIQMRFCLRFCSWQKQLLTTCVLAAISSLALRAETAVLECTGDAWLVAQSQGAAQLNGLGRELVLNGTKKVLLLNFRTSHIEGWKLQGATLMLHQHAGRPPSRLDIAILNDQWLETAPTWHFTQPKRMLSFTVTALQEGWLEVKLAPQFIEALAAGHGSGIVVSERGPANERVFGSRETLKFAPYVVVDGVQTKAR
jgi:hypothetical protein